jgi:hypothetical protein
MRATGLIPVATPNCNDESQQREQFMNQTARTLLFVGAAVVSVAIAAGTHFANKTVDLAEFSDAGELFYPDFNDPNAATALQVAATPRGKRTSSKLSSRTACGGFLHITTIPPTLRTGWPARRRR